MLIVQDDSGKEIKIPGIRGLTEQLRAEIKEQYGVKASIDIIIHGYFNGLAFAKSKEIGDNLADELGLEKKNMNLGNRIYCFGGYPKDGVEVSVYASEEEAGGN